MAVFDFRVVSEKMLRGRVNAVETHVVKPRPECRNLLFKLLSISDCGDSRGVDSWLRHVEAPLNKDFTESSSLPASMRCIGYKPGCAHARCVD